MTLFSIFAHTMLAWLLTFAFHGAVPPRQPS